MKICLLGVAALCLAGSANAAVQLDQQFVTVVQPGNAPVVARVGEVAPPPSRPNDPPTNQYVVQTFTAGLTGILDSLLFQAASFAGQSNGVFVMSLIDGDYLAGARSVVFEDAAFFDVGVTLGTAGGGITALTFDVSAADYRVTAGQRYSVLFNGVPFGANQAGGLVIGQGTAPGPNQPVFTGPGYTGGRFQGYVNGVAGPSNPAFDVGFRSFVDVTAAAVPEPGTWAMMILGFGAVGGMMRRRSATAKASRTRLTFA